MNAPAPILRTSTEFPADWPIRTAASFAPFITSGSRGWARYYSETGDLFMRITNLDRSSIYPDLSDRQHVTLPEAEREGLRTGLKAGDILISITADIGIIGFVDERIPLPAYINQHVACLRLPQDQVWPMFVAYYLASAEPQKRFIEMTDVGAKTGLNLTTVGKLAFPCPPLPEQQAIAAALSDADGVVAGLERVIAKKRLIKQGAMQDLLTARRRLPGFSGEWEVKRLGDVARVATGGRNNQDKDPMGEYPFFVRSDTVERIRSFSYDCEAILVPGEGRIGEIFHYINGRFDVHQRVYCISAFSEETSGRFIYFALRQFFGAHAMINTVKATVDSLRRPTFTGFEFRCPPSFSEQQAIAAVLSDMGAEIKALEHRLAKARAVKEGMMQNLLTGRVRLV